MRRNAKGTLASLRFPSVSVILLLLGLPSAQAQSVPVIHKAQDFTEFSLRVRRKSMRVPSLRFIVALFCLLFPLATQAQNFTTFTEWTVPGGERPAHIVASGNNGAYFVETFGGKIGFLDINTNMITEWTLPFESQPNWVVAHGQNLAIAERNGHVAVLDTDSSTLTEWEVPLLDPCCPDDRNAFAVASHGRFIFFTSNGRIGRVDSSNNELTLWVMPVGSVLAAAAIALSGPASDLQVWVTLPQVGREMFQADFAGRIGRLNPATNTFTEWRLRTLLAQATEPLVDCLDGSGQVIPCHGPIPSNLALASDGNVIFSASQGDAIFWRFGGVPPVILAHPDPIFGALNPATNIIRGWSAPALCGAGALGGGFGVSGDVAVLSQGAAAFNGGSGIGTLDLSSTPGTEYTVTPTVMVVPPTVTVVTPSITALAKKITTVTPTDTVVSRLASGGFAEYIVPGHGNFQGITAHSKRAILFGDQVGTGASNIGLLH